MAASTRRTTPVRLGAPGPYVLAMTVATLAWLPVRIWEEWHGSLPVAVVRAGLSGVIWGFVFLFVLNRWGRPPRTAAEEDRTSAWLRTETALRRGEPRADEADLAAVRDNLPGVRRGALLGAVAGAVTLGVLIGFAVHVGREATAIGFGVVLVAVLAVAARTRHRERRLRARLASVQGG
ncbi:hypothetical protein [Micromonospora sediminicola]|uniref:hypothetical protein n=1 Tax=Micromonospora sediminicola TaxID=946078 RepID=UPI0037A2E085